MVIRRPMHRSPVWLLLLAGVGAHAQSPIILTHAGLPLGDNGPAISAWLKKPTAVAVDPRSGTVYLADFTNHRVRRVTPDGVITTVAGLGFAGYNGDGIAATQATLNSPSGVAVDPSTGDLYIADTLNHRIRKVSTTTGLITTVAGTGVIGFSGDGGPAVNAQLNSPSGVAVDRYGVVYISDSGNQRVRKITPSGTITTVLGGGNPATLATPYGLAVDAAGNLFVSDTDGHKILKLATDGTVSVVAGTGTAGFSGDNGPASSAQLNRPAGLSVDALGALYVADQANQRIRKISPGANPVITTVAGTGAAGYGGDGGPALAAVLRSPSGVATASSGGYYIADSENSRIRWVDSLGQISTVIGVGSLTFNGDGIPANTAGLFNPAAVAVDASQNVYIADTYNFRVRKVSASDGRIATVAGSGVRGSSDGGGQALAAQLGVINGIAVDGAGNLYLGDSSNHVVWKVSGSSISRFAGTLGSPGYSGDGNSALSAQLSSPAGVAVDSAGNVYIADSGNNLIRKVDSNGKISTFVGASAGLKAPSGVAVGPGGELFIADTGNHKILKADASGVVITTIAGNGIPGFSGDGGPATSAPLRSPKAVAVTAAGVLYIADTGNNRIRRIGADGIISTYAGRESPGYGGDGGPAASAPLEAPGGVCVGGDGTVYIADTINDRVRKVVAGAVVVRVDTSPSNLLVTVDDNTAAAPQVFSWIPGSTHTIGTPSPQNDGQTTRYVFQSWSDGRAQKHDVVAPTAATSYTAVFQAQHKLTVQANPIAGGSVSVSPGSPDGYYSEGSTVKVSASPSPSGTYFFSGFTGDAAGTVSPITVTMNSPKSITANFTSVVLSTCTVTSDPPGLLFFADGHSFVTPHTFNWVPDSQHQIRMLAPQERLSSRFLFLSWADDLSQPNPRNVTVPVGSVTWTAKMSTYHQLVVAANTPGGGTVTLSPPAPAPFGCYQASTPSFAGALPPQPMKCYYPQGAQVKVVATPKAGYTFLGYTGDVEAKDNQQTVTMNAPKSLVAHFGALPQGNVAPFPSDVTPYVGAGASQVFTAKFTDPNGWDDLARVQIRLHESWEFKPGACAVELRLPMGQMYLRDDTGTQWLGPVAVGLPQTIENSYCRLKGAESSYSGSGNNLTWNVALEFKPQFGSGGGREPRKIVCLDAFDQSNAGDRVTCLGQWIPESTEPRLVARFRGYIPVNFEHFFTSSLNERDTLIGLIGLRPERPRPGDMYDRPTAVSGVPTQPYMRLIDNTPQLYGTWWTHYWTRDRFEYLYLSRPPSPIFVEGPEAHILSGYVPGACGFYRLKTIGTYQEQVGKDQYVAKFAEVYTYALRDEHDALVAMGWTPMGIEGYLQPTNCVRCDADGNLQNFDPGCFDEGAPGQLGMLAASRDKRKPAAGRVVSAARMMPGPVAPGERVRVYREGLSRFSRVVLEGQMMPLTEATDRYLEFIVPEGTPVNAALKLEIDDFGVRSAPALLATVEANPSLLVEGGLMGRGRARTLPSEAGTATLLLTGTGKSDKPLVARIDNIPVPVLSVSPVPDEPGVSAVKIKLPESMSGGAAVSISLGEASTQPGVFLWPQ